MFAAVTHPVAGLSLEALVTLKVEKSLIYLVGTCRPTVSIIEQRSIFFLKTLTIERQDFVAWKKFYKFVSNLTSSHSYRRSWAE
jgi:hypothetical protein